DNGMHLFKYISTKNYNDKQIYFVIKKDCEDYQKMKQYGKVLPYNSFKYKIKFLLADKIISSQADEFLTNAFGKKNKFYRDLYRFDFVFLQHGIIIDDLSTWLNIYNKNIRMFVTSVIGEYDSVINGKYGFTKEVVKLTGLPRYDNLTDENKKIIAFMPTWRKEIATPPDRETGIRAYSVDFKNSEYFKFYNKLINDKRILTVMKNKGYKGLFVVHPSHVANSIDFEKNDYIDIVDGFADYQEIFKTSSLLVSDYSSVPFDFAYLYKPVIYTQFDKENFFKSHLYQEGYFKYDKDGLGPVCKDYESTVDKIIDYINNDCKLDEKYKKRIDKFYKYHDKNNSKRVLEEIEKL
ncbi:MAG: CDP-glycerol glycerophosphotransferase family protein, partial [Bacilli bacterium]|nr:CDP-glycerol glycerophosphotransferase family protein [Bacilli bacterium]